MTALFPTTRRSVVLALSSDDAVERTRAFDTLVSIYWKPLYKLARVAWNRPPEDCEDLTQAFFARVLESDSLATYDPARANFRTFLRLLFERFVANETKASQRQKRGGGQQQLDFDAAEAEISSDGARAITPEEYFHQEWVRNLFGVAVERLRIALVDRRKETHFALFESYDLSDDRSVSYRDLAARFGIAETTVTNHLAAARREFRRILLDTLREVTASDSEFRAEARALLGGEP